MIEKINLKFEQVRELAQEVQSTSHLEFLKKRNAIKVDKDGSWIVLEQDGLAGTEAVYGYKYHNNIPYTFWNDVLRQVDYFIQKKEEKYKEQQKRL